MRSALSFLAVFTFLAGGIVAAERPTLKIQHPLEESHIQGAISLGESLGKKSAGLKLGKAGENMKPMRDDSNRSNDFLQNSGSSGGTTGFGIEVFTPTTWLARGARDAAADGKPLDPSALEEAYLAPYLRIIAYSDVPAMPTPGVYGDRVESIVLRSTPKKNYEEAAAGETRRLSTPVRTLAGHIVDKGPLVAGFSLEELYRIASLDKKGEFFVVIVSESGKEKKFKVKTKHFDDLP